MMTCDATAAYVRLQKYCNQFGVLLTSSSTLAYPFDIRDEMNCTEERTKHLYGRIGISLHNVLSILKK